MAKAIGPTFYSELLTAGLGGLPFSWRDDGTLTFAPDMPTSQIEAVQAVYTAHDPTKVVIVPDIDGFQGDLMAIFGSRAAVDAVAQKYPLFVTYLRDFNWPYTQDTIVNAMTGGFITSAQYASIKSAAATRNIPITLP